MKGNIFNWLCYFTLLFRCICKAHL